MVVQPIDELFALPVDFAAAPDVFPPDHFNAGVMVIKPSQCVWRKMLTSIHCLASYDGGDTGFLNAFFPNWYISSAASRLSFGYNALRIMQWFTKKKPEYWKAIKPLKIVHYCSSPKPWEDRIRGGELEQLWWAARDEMMTKIGTAMSPSPPIASTTTIASITTAVSATGTAVAASTAIAATPIITAQQHDVQTCPDVVVGKCDGLTFVADDKEEEGKKKMTTSAKTAPTTFQVTADVSSENDNKAAASSLSLHTGVVSWASSMDARPIRFHVWGTNDETWLPQLRHLYESIAPAVFASSSSLALSALSLSTSSSLFSSSSSSSRCLSSDAFTVDATRSCIPRIVHQIWLGGPVPTRYDSWRKSWVTHNPTWEYRLHGDDELRTSFPYSHNGPHEVVKQPILSTKMFLIVLLW